MSHVHHHSKPMLVDNSLNRAFAEKYAVYALFGISGVLFHVPSIALVAGEFTASLISAVIMCASIAASVCAWNFLRGPSWQRWELYSTIVAMVFLAVYIINLIYLASQGSTERLNAAIISTAFVIMPIWRVRFILKKSRHS